MKFQQIQLQHVRQSLRNHGFCGRTLDADLSVSSFYRKTINTEESTQQDFLSDAPDWASVSYVRTNSALERNEMPQWVADDIETVLNELVSTKTLTTKAIWFDRLGERQFKEDWPILATLHSLAAPIIYVPPTRTREYSRYQIPDKWDAPTASFVFQMEEILQECNYCGPKSPQPFDSRLLNIAACLRAWSVNEVMIANSSCGAFISSTSNERLRYTVAWYTLLLQILLDVMGYGRDVLERSVEVYGEPLFHPCSRCLGQIRDLTLKHPSFDYHYLHYTLSELLRHKGRFNLPTSRQEDINTDTNLNSNTQPDSSHGISTEGSLRRSTPQILSQRELEALSTNILRGSSSQFPCYDEGDKWLCALILSNLEQFLRAFKTTSTSLKEQTKKQIQRLLKMEKPYNEVTDWSAEQPEAINYCRKAPQCDGKPRSVCFLNELSGALTPSSVEVMLSGRGFSDNESEEILNTIQGSFRRRIQVQGLAYLCYETVRHYAVRNCAVCCKDYDVSEEEKPKKLLLLGWKSGYERDEQGAINESNEYAVYSFLTIDVFDKGHVHSRGNMSLYNHMKCQRCHTIYIRITIEGTYEQLEVHVGTRLSTASATSLVFDALGKSHMM